LSQSSPCSNVIVPSSLVATTNTLPLQIVGMVQRSDVDNAIGAYCRLLVKFNYHEFGYAIVPGTQGNFLGL